MQHVWGKKCNIKICKRTTQIQRVEKGEECLKLQRTRGSGGPFLPFFFFQDLNFFLVTRERTVYIDSYSNREGGYQSIHAKGFNGTTRTKRVTIPITQLVNAPTSVSYLILVSLYLHALSWGIRSTLYSLKTLELCAWNTRSKGDGVLFSRRRVNDFRKKKIFTLLF